MAAAKTQPFQAEVQELLDLVVHSLYTHEEVFLRELVSNASDALDKLRFEALTRPELLPDDYRASIRLEVDKDERVLRVIDNGIGMSREDLVAHLGTIASSGTRRFLEAARAEGGTGLPDLIGRFGVGFYACFMVASEVIVETRRAGEKGGTRWRSAGRGEFSLEDAKPSSSAALGTRITLRLQPQDEGPGGTRADFSDPWLLRELVQRYSDFVAYPIEMDAEPFGTGHGLREATLPDGQRVVVLNTQQPLWSRPRAEITAAEHAEFFRHLTHAGGEPLETIHFKAEGKHEYTALLYVPAERAFEPFAERHERARIALYVRRVLVMADCEALLPPWLRFVRGVVDAQDLPLNVSRETLQSNRIVGQIEERLTKKVLDALAAVLAERREDYERFFDAFGEHLKEGLITAPDHAQALTGLLLFASSRGEQRVTLGEYVAAMKPGEESIYTVRARDRAAAERAPHAEALRARGVEVLYLVDPIDEWLAERLTEYEKKPIVAADRGTASFETPLAKESREAQEREHRELLTRLEELLKDEVAGVRFSGRLAQSPAVLVDEVHALGPHMERLLRQSGGHVPERKRTLELNPGHAVVKRMGAMFDEDPTSPRLADFAYLVLAQAQIAEGTAVADPQRFARLVSELMVGGQG